MTSKKHIGQLISVKFTDRQETTNGLVIDYNHDWTLMKYNPVDYVVDGYIIFRHKNIKGYRRDKEEKFKEKVLLLKGQQPKAKEKIPLTDLKTILTFLTKKFGAFQFQTDSEDTCYLGRLVSADNTELIIDFLNTEGKWSRQRTFNPADIRTIEFNTDYINSLLLVVRQVRNKKGSL